MVLRAYCGCWLSHIEYRSNRIDRFKRHKTNANINQLTQLLTERLIWFDNNKRICWYTVTKPESKLHEKQQQQHLISNKAYWRKQPIHEQMARDWRLDEHRVYVMYLLISLSLFLSLYYILFNEFASNHFEQKAKEQQDEAELFSLVSSWDWTPNHRIYLHWTEHVPPKCGWVEEWVCIKTEPLCWYCCCFRCCYSTLITFDKSICFASPLDFRNCWLKQVVNWTFQIKRVDFPHMHTLSKRNKWVWNHRSAQLKATRTHTFFLSFILSLLFYRTSELRNSM